MKTTLYIVEVVRYLGLYRDLTTVGKYGGHYQAKHFKARHKGILG